MATFDDSAELVDRLRQLDRAAALKYPDSVFQLVIVGGGALALLGVLSRPTDDIDALLFPAQLLPLMEQFGVNARVCAYADCFPYNFEDRLVPVDFEPRAVHCYTASIEDLVVSKLYSDRDVDAEDIRLPEVLEAVDWDRLESAVHEARMSSLIERRYNEMLARYEAYREECGSCGR